jgi:hypothetical protein
MAWPESARACGGDEGMSRTDHHRPANHEILEHLAAGRIGAARAVLQARRGETSNRVRTVLSRRTDAAAAGWEAARAAINAGQRAVATGHLQILASTARDWRGPGGLLATEALADLDAFALLSAVAPRDVVSPHAVARFLERVAPDATTADARRELAAVLAADTATNADWIAMGGGGRVIALPDRDRVRVVVSRIGGRRVVKTVLAP